MKRNGPLPTPPSERFWKHITAGAPDECWEWQGSRRPPLYYGILWGGEDYPTLWAFAHRVSWEIHHGPIPPGANVLHHCDNPPCVNPAHMYIGSKADNARDRGERKRGREAHQLGESNTNAKLTEELVRAIIKELQILPRRTQTDIGRQFGISQAQVSAIMHRRSWAHLWDR